MDEFTNEEKQRLDWLYGNDFKGIRPEDAQLIGRYEAWKAKTDEAFQAEMNAMKIESEKRLESFEKQSEYSLQTLKKLRDKALERLERFSDGQKE